MGIKENWWRLNYHSVRLIGGPVFRKVWRIKVSSEGEIPNIRPVLLAPIHRTSIDTYAISYVVKEFISYVSTDNYGHASCVNYIQKLATKAMGSVIWQSSGMTNPRRRAVALARDVEDRLERRLIVAAFAQGEYQPSSVESVEDGLVGLLRRYEQRDQQMKGHDLRIPITPVGIEYRHGEEGLKLSKFAQWLVSHIPYFPDWIVPAIGSNIIVRFGETHYFDSLNSRDLTETIMREAAELSRIPYNA